MAKYKTVKRKAEVGERILITDGSYEKDWARDALVQPRYIEGDILTVIEHGYDECLVEHVLTAETNMGESVLVNHEEYEVIIENETEADGQMRSTKTRYDLAVENAREAIEELRLAAYEQGYKDATAKAPKSAQEIRDEVVEKAKRDVTDLLNEYQLSEKEVDVNQEDLTVVCKIKHLFSGKELSKGIAKCAPDDCFNVHIGKAIALRRALGLPVPDEYVYAPQPTEVRVGDVVIFRDDDVPHLVVKDGTFLIAEPIHNIHLSYAKRYFNKIIDDSRDGDCE